MQQTEQIIEQIENDIDQAERYLVTGNNDGTKFALATAIVESYLSEQGKILLAARREIENKKYGRKRNWVIKTQFIYNRLAEEKDLENTWLSESKIKRDWRRYVMLVAEIAVRI